MDPNSTPDNTIQPGGDSLDSPLDSAELRRAQKNAADLIRNKLDNLYKEEPNAIEEAVDALDASTPRSKHQQYMYDLSRSGKPLAEIQSSWHKYYTSLSDKEKHEVWQEFYAANGQAATMPAPAEPSASAEPSSKAHTRRKSDTRLVSDIKRKIVGTAGSGKKLKAKQHLQSLVFGLSAGSFVVLLLLFGFFNERFVAPFITPSRNVSSTPIIIDADSELASGPPKIIIPKINVEIPVVYDEPSIEEAAVQKALERGVVHYATTSSPGEKGNTVIFGHSSNNIFNPGKYKFAFVLLSRMDKGDLFYLTKDGTRYAYRIFKKEIVDPSNLGVLDKTNKPAAATLITCDPPGTSLKRLVVVGEQISPDPAKNKSSTAKSDKGTPNVLPSNAPSLWERLLNWINE